MALDGANEEGSWPVQLKYTRVLGPTQTDSLERLIEAGLRFASQGCEELWSTRGRTGGLAVESWNRSKI